MDEGGFLEVGIDEKGDIVVNHPDLHPDENGVGHIVFSPEQARAFARLLLLNSGAPLECHTFINRLRILASMDRDELTAARFLGKGPESERAWVEFSANPYRYLMRCDDPTAGAIWRAIKARETR